MNRRNFLKGFLAATGTLAVAPALALKPVENYGKSELWPMVEEMIEQQMYLNRLMTLQDYLIHAASKGVRLTNPQLPDDYVDIKSLDFMKEVEIIN